MLLSYIPFPLRVAWLLQHRVSRVPERDAFSAVQATFSDSGRVAALGRRRRESTLVRQEPGTFVRGAGVQADSPA